MLWNDAINRDRARKPASKIGLGAIQEQQTVCRGLVNPFDHVRTLCLQSASDPGYRLAGLVTPQNLPPLHIADGDARALRPKLQGTE